MDPEDFFAFCGGTWLIAKLLFVVAIVVLFIAALVKVVFFL